MRGNFHFFGPVLTLLCLAVNLYSARRLASYFKAGRAAAAGLAALFTALALSFPAAHPLEAAAGGAAGRAFLWFGFFWLGAGFILFWVLLAADLIYAGLGAAGVRRPPGRAWALGALAAAAALTALGLAEAAAGPRVRRVDVPLAGLPRELDGFTIAQVSDLHLGRLAGAGGLARLADEIPALKPDLVVFTGDFSERRENVPEAACALVGRLRGRYGAAAALGNHDLPSGGAPGGGFLELCGVTVLRGRAYSPAPGLDVGGVDDLRRGPLTAERAAALAGELFRPGRAAVLLSHQPQGWEAVTGGRPALVLAGHTHGGQLFPFNLLERPFFKYFYGLYRDRATEVYVTSGAGTWGPPLRLFTRSELPLLTLRPEVAAGVKKI